MFIVIFSITTSEAIIILLIMHTYSYHKGIQRTDENENLMVRVPQQHGDSQCLCGDEGCDK